MTRHFETGTAPHLQARRSVRQVMSLVLLALAPGVVAHVVLFGPGLLFQIVLACLFALVLEAAMLRVRGCALKPFLGDLSAPLTAVLFALCVPPLSPWWIALVGMTAAMVFAKHLYGGLGFNLFNPAMVGYAVVLIAFPLEVSRWLPPGNAPAALGLGDTVRVIFTGALPAAQGWDAIAQATPLDAMRNLASQGFTLSEIRADALGKPDGPSWAWIACAFALGGVFLLRMRVIAWQVPLATIATTVALTLPLWLFDPDLHASPLEHLVNGALVLAAFFIATDPVSGCTTPRGRLLFGAGVAVLTLVVRYWGAYPDGVAFAILLMNCAAPWIDLHTRPRIFGEGRGA